MFWVKEVQERTPEKKVTTEHPRRVPNNKRHCNRLAKPTNTKSE
jgi:hypothetical protein